MLRVISGVRGGLGFGVGTVAVVVRFIYGWFNCLMGRWRWDCGGGGGWGVIECK